MPTIKELVQNEAEAFAKAQKLKQSAQNVADNIKRVHDISEKAKTRP
jgi:hypothetical protein